MVKWVAPAAILLLALACGSSDDSDSGSSGATVSGLVDSAVVSADDLTGVALFKLVEENDVLVDDNVADYVATVVESQVADNDHTFTVTKVPAGQYIAKAYGAAGNLLEAPFTVSGSSASVGLSKSAGDAAQMNALTTYIVKKVAANLTAEALADTITEVLGDVDLDDVVMDGGVLKIGANGTASSANNQTAVTAINMVAMAVAAKAQSDEGDAADDFLTSIIASDNVSELSTAFQDDFADVVAEVADEGDFASAIQSAAGDFVASLDFDPVDPDFTVFDTVTEDAVKSAVFRSILLVVEETLEDLGLVEEGDDDLVDDVEEAVAGILSGNATVSMFDLAEATMGMKTDAGFEINTLAPIFMVAFADDVDQDTVEERVQVTIDDSTINSTANGVDVVWGSSNTLYMIVTSSALAAGETYDYEIAAKTGFSDNIDLSAISTSGTITTTDVTLTASEVSVALAGAVDYSGIDSDDVEFMVETKSGEELMATSNEGGLGLLTENNTFFSGEYARAFDVDEDLSIVPTGVTLTTAGGNFSAATVTMDEDITLMSGNTYYLTVEGDLTFASGNAAQGYITVKVDAK